MKWTKHLLWLLPPGVIVLAVWSWAAGVALTPGLRKVSVRVTDFDTGKPLEGIEVKAFFAVAGQAWGNAMPVEKTARTDSEGFCSLSAMASDDNVCVEARPEGYYRLQRTLLFTNLAWGTPPRALPWNPTLGFRMNRKGNPVPMFAKHLDDCHVPQMDSPCGYDLEAGDWVDPFGKGRTPDMVITIRRKSRGEKTVDGYGGRRIAEMFEFQMDVEFPGEGNGVIPVLLPEDTFRHFLRTAPESGYEQLRLTRKSYYACPPDEDAEERGWLPNPDMNYYLRVRTALDENGHVVSAQYGKVYMDFAVKSYLNSGGVFGDFTYYLNPVPNDRNIEFGKNLFDNLNARKYEKFFLVP